MSITAGSGTAQAAAGARSVLDAWAASLADVLKSMTDQRPAVDWELRAGPIEAGDAAQPLLWWEQPFAPAAASSRPAEQAPRMMVWVATPRALWEFAGGLTLKAAGLEEIAEADARNTWGEILSQSLAGMATAIGGALGEEIGCGAGTERPPDPPPEAWAAATLRFGDAPPLPLALAVGAELLRALDAATARELPPHQAVERAVAESAPAPNVELLLDVDLPVSISFGRAHLPLNEVLKLTTGSIVELNSGINDQVEVLVNHCLVARGEVVVVDGNYGVRILEIANRRERLRGVR